MLLLRVQLRFVQMNIVGFLANQESVSAGGKLAAIGLNFLKMASSRLLLVLGYAHFIDQV